MRESTYETHKLLDDAEAFAEKAHAGQKRKGNGDPYIVHPMRVAEAVRPYVSHAGVAAAYLHDVVEDTDCKDLSAFPSRVQRLVKLLTKIPGEDKIESIERVGNSFDEECILIKVADRIDNLNDGAVSFGSRWVRKYLETSRRLHEMAVRAGLKSHDLVKKLAAKIGQLEAVTSMCE